MTPYDRRLFADTTLGSLALAALAWGVMSLVDEPGMRAVDRAARLAALGPVLGALAAWLVAQRAARRGEIAAHALASVGRARALAGALVGALPLGVVCAAALASGALPVASLLPLAPGAGLTPTESGFAHAVVSLDHGLFHWRPWTAPRLGGGASARIVGASTLLLAPALAWLSSRAWRPWAGGACGLSVLVGGLVAFHAAARPGAGAWLFVAPAVAWGWALAELRPGSAAR